MNTYSRLTGANAKKGASLAKLSSGSRINKAGDDAAGLSISEKMKNQISGLTQASRNAQDGISLIQTAEGALAETHNMLNRMRDLVVQAGNGTNTPEDKKAITAELTSLEAEIENISKTTKFNGQALLDGSKATTALNFQIGANSGETLELNIGDMSASGLGITGKMDITDSKAINGDPDDVDVKGTIDVLDDAISKVSEQRSNLGAVQNRLDHTISNLSTTRENLSEANSRIRDVDMAEEMMEFTKNNILSQAATSMLAQANQMPQSVLQLLG